MPPMTASARTSIRSGDFLKREFLLRQQGNPRYSLRRFAKDLGLSHPFLSQVLNGRKKLSEERAREIAQLTNWNRARQIDFIKLVRADLCPSDAERKKILSGIKTSSQAFTRFESLALDRFRLISDWYHFAIAEMTTIQSIATDPEAIAGRFGLTPLLAAKAIERLLDSQLLERDATGRLKKSVGNYTTGNIPSSAIRRYHRSMLNKAHAAIETQDPIDRDFSGLTMAIDPKNIPKAKKMIADFRRELMTTLESGNPSAVYHFSAQLFRLDIEQEKK